MGAIRREQIEGVTLCLRCGESTTNAWPLIERDTEIYTGHLCVPCIDAWWNLGVRRCARCHAHVTDGGLPLYLVQGRSRFRAWLCEACALQRVWQSWGEVFVWITAIHHRSLPHWRTPEQRRMRRRYYEGLLPHERRRYLDGLRAYRQRRVSA